MHRMLLALVVLVVAACQAAAPPEPPASELTGAGPTGAPAQPSPAWRSPTAPAHATPAATPAASPVVLPRATVYFYIEMRDRQDIWSLTTDGGVAAPVAGASGTSGPFYTDPALADHDQMLLFVWQDEAEHNAHIYELDRSTGHQRQLTSGSFYDEWPVASPDGKRIAFARRTPTGDGGIFVMNADGSRIRRLTTPTEVDQGDEMPAWSPDGKRIAFQRGHPGALDVVDVASGAVTEILPKTDAVWRPRWSPDGTQIAFGHPDDAADHGIWLVRPDGAGLHRIGTSGDWEGDPFWSPDGTWLVAWGVDSAHNARGILFLRPDGSDRTFVWKTSINSNRYPQGPVMASGS
jgi:TolB protein